MVLDFIERDFIDKDAFKGSRTLFFSPIDYPTYYDSVFLPDQFKVKFAQRLEGFQSELQKTGVSPYVIKDLMGKLDTVHKRSISTDFKYEEMAKCKDMTDKLDKIRKEKFNDIFPYYKNSNDFITNIKTVI